METPFRRVVISRLRALPRARGVPTVYPSSRRPCLTARVSDFSRPSSFPLGRPSLCVTPHPAPHPGSTNAQGLLDLTNDKWGASKATADRTRSDGLRQWGAPAIYKGYVIVLAILEAISLSLLVSMLAGCATNPPAVVKDSLTAKAPADDGTVYSNIITNRPVRHPEAIQPPPTPK